jgi:hypothetical protein
VRLAHPREKTPQIIENFSDCANRLNADYSQRIFCSIAIAGRAARLLYQHLVLLHLAKELPCISPNVFYIPALPLCVYGVKSQRAFSRARNTGYYNQLILGIVTSIFLGCVPWRLLLQSRFFCIFLPAFIVALKPEL